MADLEFWLLTDTHAEYGIRTQVNKIYYLNTIVLKKDIIFAERV